MHPRSLTRLFALALAATILPAHSCKDNLGQGGPPAALVFRVSVQKDGVQAEGASVTPWISGDGRFVVFASKAPNLVIGTIGFQEILVRDRWTDTVENITNLVQDPFPANLADCLNPSISANGRYVAFETLGWLNNTGVVGPQTTLNVYIYDRQRKVMKRGVNNSTSGPAWPNGDCHHATVADDGIHFACVSAATNLLGAPPLSGADQIVVGDLTNNDPTIGGYTTFTLVSRTAAAANTEGNAACQDSQISANGQFVAFTSGATNLTNPATNGRRHVFVGTTAGDPCELISQTSGSPGTELDGDEGVPVIGNDGRFVAFLSSSTNLVPGFTPGAGNNAFLIAVRDRTANTTTAASTNGIMLALFGPPFLPLDRISMSDDGRLIAYLGASDAQLHVVEVNGADRTVSVGPTGPADNISVLFPSMSGNGDWLVWQTDADNLIVGDTNGATDIYGYGPIR